MPYDDDVPMVDEQLAGGSCPYCGQPIALVEIESADGGIRLERAPLQELAQSTSPFTTRELQRVVKTVSPPSPTATRGGTLNKLPSGEGRKTRLHPTRITTDFVPKASTVQSEKASGWSSFPWLRTFDLWRQRRSHFSELCRPRGTSYCRYPAPSQSCRPWPCARLGARAGSNVDKWGLRKRLWELAADFRREDTAWSKDTKLSRWRIVMVTSKTIAGLIGPTLVAVAAALLLNLGSISAVLEPLSRNPALVLIYGIFLFVAGLAIVRFHNHWVAHWSVLVTILGWLLLVGG